MAELIIPKSALACAVGILADLPAPAATKAPKTWTGAFVRVSRIGGGKPNLATDRATLLIECFSPDSVEAENLANHARGLMGAAQQGVFNGARVLGWDNENGPVDFPDGTAGWERFQVTGDLLVSTQ